MNKLFFALMLLSLTTLSQSKYHIVPNKNLLQWKGADVLGNGHSGTLAIESGYLSANQDDFPVKGEFTIDMNTIHSIDERTGGGIEELDKHLKSEDFFAVDEYPKAFFTITDVRIITPFLNKYNIKGLLSIKRIIKPITFSADITTSGKTARVVGDIVIDRTQWNIVYQSKNFLANLKDTAIADEIKLHLELILQKK
jgi:polyisoprenoid-binding protein YceI